MEVSEQTAYEHLGERALAYLLATDEVAIRTRFAGGSTEKFDQRREEVLAWLVELDEQMRSWNQPSFPMRNEWSRKLSERHGSVDISLGNYARQSSGGILPSVPTILMPLEEALAGLALECYPEILVKEPKGLFEQVTPITLYRHPLNVEFQKIIMQDPDLSRLFPNTDDSNGPHGNTIRSSGQGGSSQLSSFAEVIIMSGWKLAHVRLERPSIEEHLNAVLENLEIIRSAIRGELVTIPGRLGLVGVLLPDDIDRIDLGGVLIRRADRRDEQFVDITLLDGQLTTTSPGGDTVVINYSGDLVVEFEIPYVIRSGSMHLLDEWPAVLRGAQTLIAELKENIRLGLLLVSPDRRLNLLPTWQVNLDPLSQGTSASWSDARQAPALVPTQLTLEQSIEWREWSMRIETYRIPTIAVAIRRMLASVAERGTPDDVLVDAVIVWENLFGGRGETMLRVTSSLAWLLGASAQDRRARQNRYKKIYNTRSAVVHGEANVNQKHLLEHSAEAVQVSAEALRAIFGSRTALLGVPTSDARSLQILYEG